MPKIAVLDDYLDSARQFADWSSLPTDCELTVFRDHLHEDDQIVERLRPFDIVCPMRERTPFPKGLLVRLPKLKLLATTSKRNHAIDLVAAAKLGITVCGTGLPDTGDGTAELTWGLILGFARQIPSEDRTIKAGGWQSTVGRTVKGLTLGVVGLGRLGRPVARIGAAFGMRVIAWSPNLTAARAGTDAEAVSRERLFTQSDFVTIHMALSEASRGLIGGQDIGRMQPDAVLVNTSRGPLVEEAALVEALEKGTIAGAALDVFDVEPLPLDHPFRTLPNTVLTGHVGYQTQATYRIFFEDTVDNINKFLRGEPTGRRLNPAAAQDDTKPLFLDD
jgi:phosphoglycerate dehydrogenase-like enzyme